MSGAPSVIGVVGAGTMGGGIAQLACLAGARTLLHDPDHDALDRGLAGLRANLEKGAERGRWSALEAAAALERVEPAHTLEALAPCELTIEAAPESLELKRELFARLAEIVSPACVLATNTSSIPVTAVAAAAARPERVVGMHFFNPAPLMRLLEVVAGAESGTEALALARATGEAMGKVVIDAADGPGFLVNRVNRPFSLEALRLLAERLATVEQIDRICRLGGGFRMGPFELMDLVGIDVGFDVARSFHEQSFGEPRWRPSPLSARLVAAGRTGRKAGRGWYEYRDGPHRPPDPQPPPVGGGDGVVLVDGGQPLAEALRACARDAGWEVRDPGDGEAMVTLACDPARPALLADGGAVGFHALPPLAPGGLIELARTPGLSAGAAGAAERFFATLGMHTEWVGDAPGLVLGRIVCQLVNEAAFAVGEGVGSAADVDLGVLHGLNYPRGILAWADEIGLDHVLAVLDALADEYREERYRAAPLLRRLAGAGERFLRDDKESA